MIVKSLKILRCLACPLTILALSACQVNQDPLAVLTTDRLCVEVGEGLTFSAAGSYDPEGGELVYSFDFGDGAHELIASGKPAGDTVERIAHPFQVDVTPQPVFRNHAGQDAAKPFRQQRPILA